jgi:hypothetical protein
VGPLDGRALRVRQHRLRRDRGLRVLRRPGQTSARCAGPLGMCTPG